jgi:transcriptional regulator with XRE-family HTH domain
MLAEVICSVRLQKGFTQEEAAEKAGVSLRTYQRLEHGKRDILDASMRTGLGVCAALGIDPLSLILDEEQLADS